MEWIGICSCCFTFNFGLDINNRVRIQFIVSDLMWIFVSGSKITIILKISIFWFPVYTFGPGPETNPVADIFFSRICSGSGFNLNDELHLWCCFSGWIDGIPSCLPTLDRPTLIEYHGSESPMIILHWTLEINSHSNQIQCLQVLNMKEVKCRKMHVMISFPPSQ